MELTPIQLFYKGRSVLVTGATGFCGKALLEKLLRSCADVGKIYLLMRPKRGEDLSIRFARLLDDPLFDDVRKDMNSVQRKVSLIQGDLLETGLGLSPQNRRELCQEVSIVFHVAATIRFNENLKVALQTNVIATQEIVNLCKEMPLLAALVYVSTAFSQYPLNEVHEKAYQPPDDPRRISDTVKWLTEADFTVTEPATLAVRSILKSAAVRLIQTRTTCGSSSLGK
uniref:Fatty acyl-CoA reductase n=1 Tax=Coptotermes formosanus TaxID=36987 RepID=R4UNF4_COPFO|nr:fatty acyl-coA reductase like protein [Coptotermes formosanus]